MKKYISNCFCNIYSIFNETNMPKLHIGGEKYPALTGVRAIGAMVVFFDHFPFVPESHVVINVLAFFFVLSGFLIVHLYYTEKT